MESDFSTVVVDNLVQKGGKTMKQLGEKGITNSFPLKSKVVPKVLHRVFHDSGQRVLRKSTDTTNTTNLINIWCY